MFYYISCYLTIPWETVGNDKLMQSHEHESRFCGLYVSMVQLEENNPEVPSHKMQVLSYIKTVQKVLELKPILKYV